jgi:hypothetical protein
VSQLLTAWNTLSEDKQAGTGLLATRLQLSAVCGTLAAIERPSGRRAIVLEVHPSAIPAALRFSPALGYEVDVSPVPGHANTLISVALIARDSRYNSLFAALANDVIDVVVKAATQNGCIEALSERLQIWQGFFRNARLEGLSENAQRGLFAELWFLLNHAFRCLEPRYALLAWTGPTGTNQDFQFLPACVEVKSSTSQPSARIHVSNARQLDATGIPALYLYVLQMDVRLTHGLSLIEQIDSVSARLMQLQPAALAPFLDLLLQVGYDETQRELYKDTHYAVRQESLFEIRSDFPRLIESDLRLGVGNLKYTVDLAACEPFRHALDDIDGLLKPARNVD